MDGGGPMQQAPYAGQSGGGVGGMGGGGAGGGGGVPAGGFVNAERRDSLPGVPAGRQMCNTAATAGVVAPSPNSIGFSASSYIIKGRWKVLRKIGAGAFGNYYYYTYIFYFLFLISYFLFLISYFLFLIS